jgi:outer membrane protein OmpA-like peptidoglycan-associated protein
MNIKLISILLFIFIASSTLLSQAQNNYGNESAYNTTWQKNAFGDNWYISFGSGAQILMSEDDSKADFTSRLTYAPTITIGKYFSPLFGLRLNFTGGSLHGFNDGVNGLYSKWTKNGSGYIGDGYAGTPGYPAKMGVEFLTWDPVWNYKGYELGREISQAPDGSYFWVPGHARGDLYMQHVRYAAVSANAMLDVVTLFGGYNPRRVFNITPFVGPTLYYVFAHHGQDSQVNLGFNAGLNARFRLNKYLDFFVEGSGFLMPDDFDGHVGGGKRNDIVVQGVAGVSFKLGKQYWERCDHADYDLIARLNDEINRLRNKPCCPLIEPVRPVPDLFATYITPEEEKIKRREISDEAYLIFQVNRTELRQDLGNNMSELTKITKSIDFVKEEPDVDVDRIFITGFASPEGTEQGNIRLSEGRSKAVKDYVKVLYRFEESMFVVRSNGENWDGLAKALERTTLSEQEKLDIADIISISNVTTRKSRLKAYKGGRPYQYLLSEIYPSLRRTDYKIEYTVPQFSLERGKQLIGTKPQMLSQYEMYQIANSYPQGSPEFARALETAVSLYPNDLTANINAAAVALKRNELERAASYLEKFKSDPKAYNNLAILYALQGKEQEARMYFKLALENGDPKAADNLEKMNGFQDVLDKYNEEMEQYLQMLEQVRADQEN